MIEKDLLNIATAEIITWLDCADYEQALGIIQQWDEATWQAAKWAVFMQGVGPYFSQTLPQTPLYPYLPGWFQEGLNTTYALNTERVARFQTDLQILLHEANQDGIPVMPIKGSLLTTQIYPDASIRPMADLDLLVRPADRQSMGQILTKQGYAFITPKTKWSHHDLYINPAGDRVVAVDEHPDNPRPVEVHGSLESKLWGGFPSPDLTHHFWDTSHRGILLGKPVFLPATTNHFAYIAIHHLRHMLMGSGRAIQWLDLALMVGSIPDIYNLPHRNLIYPALRFAARGFPSYFKDVNWSKLAQNVHPRVREWCQTTPLDAHSGLQTGKTHRIGGRWGLRWIRWHPTPVRLALIYGEMPLPIAYLRFSTTGLRDITR